MRKRNIDQKIKKDNKNDYESTKSKGTSKDLIEDKSSFPINYHLVLLLLLIPRLISVYISNIQDCDEVFNYWEPLHFLSHGKGFQTWEYSPEYAIRSYAYLLLHYPIVYIFKSNKIVAFYALKTVLTIICAACEASLVISIKNRLSYKMALYTLILLFFNSGLQHAASALLPSSFAMYTTTYFLSLELKTENQIFLKIATLGIGALLGWPFSAAVGLPFALYFILNKLSMSNIISKAFKLIMYASICFIIIMAHIVLIDFYFYKKYTLVPFNIVLYNVLNANSNSGPDIFGVEKWHFYFLNLFLNFNVALLFALLSLPLHFIIYLIGFPAHFKITWAKLGSILSVFYLWLAIFSIQPHKEERFMYVVYTCISFNAAISIYYLIHMLNAIFHRMVKNEPIINSLNKMIKIGVKLVFGLYILLSLSRTYAQYHYYHGYINIYKHVPNNIDQTYNINLCVGDEWYRFPSHYHLEDNIRLKFIKQNFDGLLPQPFIEKVGWRNATSFIPKNNNNRNKEVLDRYIPIEQCDYQITTLETIDRNVIHCQKVLKSDSIPKLFRAFYLPPRISGYYPKFNYHCLVQM